MPVIGTPWHSGPGDAFFQPHSRSSRLKANELLPGDLAFQADEHFRALAADVAPANHLEKILVKQVARHAAALDVAHASEVTILETGGLRATLVDPRVVPADNAQRIGAMTSPALLPLGAYQARHERGLYGAVRQLKHLQEAQPTVAIPVLFATEKECVEYLRSWQQRQPWTCLECGSTARCFLTGRDFFECACGKQSSIRFSTIYAGSHMPLQVWFGVICHVMCDRSICGSELANKLKVDRTTTIKQMMAKVGDALASPQADQRLAGVNQLLLSSLHKALIQQTNS